MSGGGCGVGICRLFFGPCPRVDVRSPKCESGLCQNRVTHGDTFSIDEAWLSSQGPLRSDGSDPLPLTLQDQEKDMIESALGKSRGKVAGPRGAAARLGIPASTLESKIKQ